MTTSRVRLPIAVLFAALGLALAYVGASAQADPGPAAPAQDPTEVPVGGVIQAENACYVRLPDLPGARYGMFGAYNWNTGILAAVGGAEKSDAAGNITTVFPDMYAIDVTAQGSDWRSIPYGQSGYNRAFDKGCREMSSVAIDPENHLSVGGKDGCKGADSSSGDIKALRVKGSASGSGVSWVPNSGASENLPQELDAESFKLVRNFAAWDSERGRLIFGQGTFDDTKDQDTQDEIYTASQQGSKWNIRQMFPQGQVPSRRFGTCAAYVNIPEDDVDGVIVLGGQQGGDVGTTSYEEVWWLDFSGRNNGEWVDITDRFTNMDAIGYRREGACAYDSGTQTFYSWMGRASSSIPDGNSRSAGFWRTDLSSLGDEQAPLSWERLAKDDLEGINGRRLIPSVWDPVNKRAFVVGGRNRVDEYQDVWALYPDITGAECQNLDYTTMVPTPAPEPTDTPMPTDTPDPALPTETPGGAAPTATPVNTPEPVPGEAKVCDFIDGRVPQASINFALTNKDRVYGWGDLCFPTRPQNPFNGFREHLSIHTISKPYHPMYNPVVYKCGCP